MMNLFEKFNIKTENEKLYKIAFTHSSYSLVHEKNYDYERLEFLGDSILNLIVSQYLFNKYPKYGEGKLTKIRSNYVCQNALIYYSQEIGLTDFLLVSKEELKLTQNEIIAITADIFESFLGAVFTDQGFDFTKELISKIIFKHIDSGKIFFNDYKSKLKEHCDVKGASLEYKILKEYGVPHDKIFIVACFINGEECGLGRGKNKKEAEQSSAKSALTNLNWVIR